MNQTRAAETPQKDVVAADTTALPVHVRDQHPAGNGGPRGPWQAVAEADWNNWKWQQAHRLRRRAEFETTPIATNPVKTAS